MSGKLNKFWLVIAALLALLALAGCIYAAISGSAYIRPDGGAQDTVLRFCEALVAGDYPAAYECLGDYASLGLEHTPESPEAALLYDALRESYSYSLVGDCETEKLAATQELRLRSLNIGRVQLDAARLVDGIVEELAEARPGEVYDGEGRVLPQAAEEAYLLALERTLEHAEDYMMTGRFTVALQYSGGRWLMSTNPELLSAISGGLM